jgi:tRNA uridine 5-carboxymethylaminomethyl modification enzyme
VGSSRTVAFQGKQQELERLRANLRGIVLTPDQAAASGFGVNRDGVRRTAYELLSFPEIDLNRLSNAWPELMAYSAIAREQVQTEARYAAYIRRQEADIKNFRREETAPLPDLDVDAIPGLSNEVRQKLKLVQPKSLGHASRIEGMTPAALGLLLAWSRRAAGDRPGVA